ncbi:hemerythrin domain-containing protein [Methanobacterium sp. ACI-7]|uniref:hemerythrin domain-containing protein n=1 Tax=unclassified Methanobacterium TaxID=2627676 RepID=UPI0039C22B92
MAEYKDMYDLLISDHEMVKGMINETLQKRDASRFKEIKTNLEIHMMGEERFFYPLLREQDKETMDKSYQEHHVGKVVLHELKKMDKDDEHWIPKMKVLNDILNHHIEEEEKQIFPESRRLLSEEQQDKIFKRLKQAKSLMTKQPMAKILEVR